MTEVQIPKTQAKNTIDDMVDGGKEILEQLTLEHLGLTGNPLEIFAQAQENEGSWSAGILNLLSGGHIFDDEAIATEYKNLTVGIVREDLSLAHNVSALQEIIAEKLSWLKGLVKRVDEMPQSDLTVGGAVLLEWNSY